MKHTARKIGITVIVILNCLLIFSLHSCKSNSDTSNYMRCEDSLSMYTKTTVSTDTTTMANDNDTATTVDKEGHIRHKMSKGHSESYAENANEPTGPGTLVVTSSAFENYGVIPVKYTCDGSGVTPPLKVTGMPEGTKSLALIVHDYNAGPEGGRTFWIIWNLDTYGIIPENFHSDHEGMNEAKQYGNTPLCAKSGNHKYHFIVYALECNLVIGKNTTKSSIEKVMRGHVLAKGELVGVYNRRLD